MSHPKFKHRGHIFDRASEECAELIVAIAKARRFGMERFNPSDPSETTNREAILNEIEDVHDALVELKREVSR